MTEPVTQGDQELHNTVVGTLQAENKQYAHNSSLCKPETEENRLDSQESYKEKTLDEYRKEWLDWHLIAGINFIRQLNSVVNKWYK